MTSPTRRQAEVLAFIKSFIAERGYAPSFEEIAKGMGLASLATVSKHIQGLKNRGQIRVSWNTSRSITICDPIAEELRALLQHQIHRNHEVAAGCSACARSLELIGVTR